MDFDAIKSRAQQVKAPPVGPPALGERPASIDGLVAQLRAADERQRGGLRKALPLYLIATVCWVLFFAAMSWLPGGTQSVARPLFWGSLAGVYVLVTAGVLWRLRRLGEIDYAAPTREFLARAERRYRFMGLWGHITGTVGCLLLGAAAGPYVVNLMLSRYVGPQHRATVITWYCILYAAVCVMGFVFTYLDWRRDRKPLWHATRQMLAELDAEEQTATDADTDKTAP